MELSINLEIVFGERCYSDYDYCLGLINKNGVNVFEIWNHRFFDIEKLKATAIKYSMRLSCLSGNRECNLLEHEMRKPLMAQLEENIGVAKSLGGRHVTILSECLNEDDLSVVPTLKPMSEAEKLINAYKGLCICAEIAEVHGITLNLETLNSLVDHAGYFFTNIDIAVALIKSTGKSNIKLLFDIYHAQIMEGNIINQIEKYLDYVDVFHIADVPGRHEPGTGEINYKNIASFLRSSGFSGYVVLESSPSDGNPETAIAKFIKIFSN